MRAPSGSADAGSFATGRSSTGRIMATRRATHFPPYAWTAGTRTVRERARSAPSAAVSRAPSASGRGTLPACRGSSRRGSRASSRSPRSPSGIEAAGQRHARRVQPVHSARRGRFGLARRRPAIRCDEPPGGAGHSVDCVVDREPVADGSSRGYRPEPRVNDVRTADGIQGLLMHESPFTRTTPLNGSFVLWVLGAGEGDVTTSAAGRARGGGRAPCVSGTTSRTTVRSVPSPRARTRRRGLPAAHDRARRVGGLHVPAGLALPEPHAATMRLDARRKATSSAVIGNYYCTRFRGCVGGGGVRGGAARRTRGGDARVRAGGAREHAARRRQGRRHGEPLDARDARPASAPPTASSTGSRAATTRAAAASATARTSGTTRPRRRTSSRASRVRSAAPPSATRMDDDGAMHFRQLLRTARRVRASPPPTARWARS